MAFLSKFGNILRQSGAKQVNSESSLFKLSISQAVRCMSSGGSSKLFVGGTYAFAFEILYKMLFPFWCYV